VILLVGIAGLVLVADKSALPQQIAILWRGVCIEMRSVRMTSGM